MAKKPGETPQAPGYHVFQVTDICPRESFVDCVDKMKKELHDREPAPQEMEEAVKVLRARAAIDYPGLVSGARES